MNTSWHSFLLSHGAVNSAVMGQARITDTLLVDLSHLGLIAVAGADAASFLQGQLSNDLNDVTGARSQLSAWCSAKGRVLVLLRVFRRDDIYYLQLTRDVLETTLKRLRMYVLRSRVVLTDASDTFGAVGLCGPATPALLTRSLGVPPPAVDGVVHGSDAHRSLTVLGLPGAQPRFEIVADIETTKDLWRQYAEDATSGDSAVWSLLDIRAGLPAIHSATQDAFIPQMINLDLIGAVSFTKGCYPGQEIVARTQHLGTAKRRMYYARVHTTAAPEPGATLYSAEAGQAIGQVIEAARGSAEDVELLAVVTTTDVVNQRVSLHGAEGPVLRFIKLPYPMPE